MPSELTGYKETLRDFSEGYLVPFLKDGEPSTCA